MKEDWTSQLDSTPLRDLAKIVSQTILVALFSRYLLKLLAWNCLHRAWLNEIFLCFITVNMHSLGGTMPRQHPVVSMSGLSLIPQPSFIGGPSMMGHPTLRRQSSHDMDQNMPRILSRNAANVQYYYGWQTPPTLLSPAIVQTPIFSPVCSSANSMRPMSISAPSAASQQPLTITTTSANSENQVASSSNTSTSGESGMGISRTYCF